MPIISRIGRRSLKVRLFIVGIYVALLAGAVTMVYPFLLMISGSTASNVDGVELKVMPSFLVNDTALYRKHLEGFFNESLQAMQGAYDIDATSFTTIEPPADLKPALVKEWKEFLAQAHLPFYCSAMSFIRAPISRGVQPANLRAFRAGMDKKCDGDLATFNREMGVEFADWTAFYLMPEDYLQRRNTPTDEPMNVEFRKFKASRPIDQCYFFNIEGYYKRAFLAVQYGRDIEGYNKSHGTSYKDYSDLHFDRRLPQGPGRTDQERADWTSFVRTYLNLLWIRADQEAAPLYRQFLQAKYKDIAVLNRTCGTSYPSFQEVPLIQEPPRQGLALSDWDAFIQGWKDPESGTMFQLPDEMLSIHSVEFMFRDYLQTKYKDVSALNAAMGSRCDNWLAIKPPQEQAVYQAFVNQRTPQRGEFVKRNFVAVFDQVILHGRAVFNTAVYCILAIAGALIVNPLAAYALSRYKPPSTYKVLLLLMLTMAFPPIVTQIPVFLMLRQFHMLNTYWALLLPGLASGYSIFLLKGFFDSLPQELYESAALDGAGEVRIFWQITMSLSKPILAVIALAAFTGAYGNFMFAMLICTDPNMWTLMPWLFQLQVRSSQGVVFASLLVASIPTFLVFAFCQNIIMRGIVVPVEK